MIGFVGVHLGRTSLSGRLLDPGGESLAAWQRRYRGAKELTEALAHLLEALPPLEPGSVVGIGLEKGHRISLPLGELEKRLPEGVSLLSFPAGLAILLGAVPSGPAMLLALGSDLRIAALDSTHTYREYRLQEGGGQWWTLEVKRLAEHSQRLTRALSSFETPPQVMKALPRLLELGDFPSPDPVLKARLDGLGETIAQSCIGLASRLPGIRRLVMSGFLYPSPLSRRVEEACQGVLGLPKPHFSADVGAALLGLALYRENQERQHLGKPLETGRFPATEWGASPVLLRRLYRLRRPFEAFRRAGDP